MACSAACSSVILFCSAQFEGSTTPSKQEGWNSLDLRAIDGTSLLRPASQSSIWFTADIGLSTTSHHLCSRIPNYPSRLPSTHMRPCLTEPPTLTVRSDFRDLLCLSSSGDRSTDSLAIRMKQRSAARLSARPQQSAQAGGRADPALTQLTDWGKLTEPGADSGAICARRPLLAPLKPGVDWPDFDLVLVFIGLEG